MKSKPETVIFSMYNTFFERFLLSSSVMEPEAPCANRLVTIGRGVGVIGIPWALYLYIKYHHSFQLIPYIVFFVVLAALLAACWKYVLQALWALGPVWLLLLWAGLSFLWSANRPGTLFAFCGLIAVTGYAIMFSVYYSVKEQLHILGACTLAFASINLALVVFFPRLGIMSGLHAGAWMGLVGHKNGLGNYIALGVVLFALGTGGKTGYRLLSWTGLVACLVLLIGSRSVTGIFAACAGLAAYGVAISLRNPPWGIERSYVSIVWAAAAILFAGWFFAHTDFALSLVGRDATLSRRTELWMILLDKGAEHRWLGYGLNSFWRWWGNGAYFEIMPELGWYRDHAHNGMLDVYLELGLVGVLIFLACLVRVMNQAFRIAIRGRQTVDYWHVGLLALMITTNLAESMLLKHNSLNWFLFVAATCNLFGTPGAVSLGMPAGKRSCHPSAH